jgi:predicted secreted protein
MVLKKKHKGKEKNKYLCAFVCKIEVNMSVMFVMRPIVVYTYRSDKDKHIGTVKSKSKDLKKKKY